MASRTRASTTLRARYGTVSAPTSPARPRAREAKTAVAATLPASLAADEKTAAAKARASPASANRNRSQASRSTLASRDLNRVLMMPALVWHSHLLGASQNRLGPDRAHPLCLRFTILMGN